jgi:bifunctional UDP-N-acetylglucosamine pyrophosphorylase/glucosamine-1-phosphate N-acetyltransferase
MITGIILAAGQGKRLNCQDKNKTSLDFVGKPLVTYGVDLFSSVAEHTVVVVGAFAESVKSALSDYPVIYAYQSERLGTGHAVQIAFDAIEQNHLHPDLVLVGYGDHMMFYTPKIVNDLINNHKKSNSAISLISTKLKNPDNYAWGRIVRDTKGHVLKIVEQKDATQDERRIEESNAGFYCFNYNFLSENLTKLTKSPVSNEYYLTDLIEMANQQHLKVSAHLVPFQYVGIGINTPDQLEQSRDLFKTLNN